MTPVAVLQALLQELGAFGDRLVFTGGLVLPLYFEQPPPFRIRPTKDADAVVACTSHAEYISIQMELGKLRIWPVSDDPDAPICRMRTLKGQLLDLMPADPAVLKFGNRWFPEGFRRAISYDLGDEQTIRLFPAPLYLAAKAEAFRSRGEHDPWSSHDLEDLFVLLACRPSLEADMRSETPEVRAYVAEFAARLLALEGFEDLLKGNVSEREGLVITMLSSFMRS